MQTNSNKEIECNDINNQVTRYNKNKYQRKDVDTKRNIYLAILRFGVMLSRDYDILSSLIRFTIVNEQVAMIRSSYMILYT